MAETFATLVVSRDARGITTVTLNRPDRGNALGQQMMRELLGFVAEAAGDDTVRVVVLRGAGRHFCTGADVGERGASTEGRVELVDLLTAVDQLGKPVVAVVQGGCVGGGLALAICCDVVLAVEEAFFSVPELRLGLVPTGLLPFFVRALGPRALRLYGLSGERIMATEAVRLGVASAMVPEVGIAAELDALTDSLLLAAPGAVALFKRRLAPYAAMAGEPIADDVERSWEIAEGVASFKERRKPVWYPQRETMADG
jgi:methylglutaconyl-CoA hydratase